MRAAARLMVTVLLAVGALVAGGGAASAAGTVTNSYDGGFFTDVGACSAEGQRLHWRDQNLHEGYWNTFACVVHPGGYRLIVQHTVFPPTVPPKTVWTNYRFYEYMSYPGDSGVPDMSARGCSPVMRYLMNQGIKAQCVAATGGYMLQTGS